MAQKNILHFFCLALAETKKLRRFAFHFEASLLNGRLSDSIRVVQRFLVPFVLVRIQVGQQTIFGLCIKQHNPIFFNQH